MTPFEMVHARFQELSAGELFTTDVNGLFEAYLAAFPAGTNPIRKTRTVHDCNCCKQFIRRLGGLVAIKNGVKSSIWQVANLPHPFDFVAEKLHRAVVESKVTGVFRTKEHGYGTHHNYEKATNERHEHFYGNVDSKHHRDAPDAEIGKCKEAHDMLKAGLELFEITHFEQVLDLIAENQLYKGREFKPAIVAFRGLLVAYREAADRDVFLWENINHSQARFKNTAIGSLFEDLAKGMEFDAAVRSYESKVAPTNYKRPTAVITQKMVEQAVEKLTNLGLLGAINRRYARLSDVSINDVLFVDNAAKGQMKDGISALLESSVAKSKPDFKNSIPVSADQFVKDVLPTAKSIEVLVENRHAGNFVSLTGGDGPERLFKWDNNFAWSYDGDVADSVKARVKAAGGKIDCTLRVSLSWFNTDDLDLHAQVPHGPHVYFGNKSHILDVDMNAGHLVRNPVENLAFNTLNNGVYRVWVEQFNQRETTDVGFAIEVEYAGVVHQYNYAKAVKGNVQCFQLHVAGGKLVRIETELEGGKTSQDKWGVKTETLTPVVAIMTSPNHWNGQAIGAKHLIFALKDCVNPDSARGIYNEFLRGEFEQHRKVFEVLGAKTKCKPSAEQISGVGFTAARNDTVTILVDGRRSYTIGF